MLIYYLSSISLGSSQKNYKRRAESVVALGIISFPR